MVGDKQVKVGLNCLTQRNAKTFYSQIIFAFQCIKTFSSFLLQEYDIMNYIYYKRKEESYYDRRTKKEIRRNFCR